MPSPDQFLYLLANVGVGMSADEPAGGWGPAPDGAPADGDTFQDRFVYLLGNVGVAFHPTDVTTGGPADDVFPADGYTLDFDRYLYLLANAGVGFDPTDTPAAGWDPEGIGGLGPADGYTLDFLRTIYLLIGDVTDDTPTPHLWYLFPTSGEEGNEFAAIGYGFGDTQGEYTGSVELNGTPAGVISWVGVAESAATLIIDPDTDTAEPIHQRITLTVPVGATSGLVIVCTDGP